MVRLKNIKFNNTFIECEIFPEDSITSGMLKVDINSKKVVEYTLPDEYEWCTNHVGHAVRGLIELLEDIDNIPSERLIMWY